MNSNQLFQFRTIAELGSITKASEQLYISQPALSIALGKLEYEIGCPLFIRDGKKLQITEAGKKLLEYAITVTDTIRQAKDYFNLAGKNKDKQISLYRIGGINYPLISKGCASSDKYFLRSMLIDNTGIPSIVKSNEADGILTDDRYIKTVSPNLVNELLFHQFLLLSVPINNILAKKDSVDIRELQSHSTIGRANPFGFNAWLSEITQLNRCVLREDMTIDFTSWRIESVELTKPYLMNNFGISTIHDGLAGRKLLRVTGEYTARNIFMWYRAGEKTRLLPLLEKIKENTNAILDMDKEFNKLQTI
jgi:DNA-binding transcriptional LysR family regulator